jgi:protoporphyrinogen oxidase
MTIVVVGAGLTGLTIASELAARGRAVTVVERDGAVGGLARTFRHGERFFDVGPHRFHTDDARLRDWIAGVLQGELTTIRRSSAVHAFGRLHDWPLRPRVLTRLPAGILARASLDLLRRSAGGGESFEAEMKARYGATLYAAFFEPYTRRFLDIDPALLHRDWGRAGVDRAVIDRRVRAGGLRDLLRGLVLPAPAEAVFLYPRLGIGRLAERLAERVAAGGGEVLLRSPVSAIEAEGGRITAVVAGARRIAAEGVVWTAPLTSASRMLGLDDRGLRFRSTVLFHVALRRAPRNGRQWTYFGGEPAFVRVSTPAAFSPAAAPEGKGGVCVERTCTEGDPTWTSPEPLVPEVLAALVRNGVIEASGDVEGVHVERVADTYPIYTLEYLRARDACLASLARFRNLLLAGRCGRFWYNNMDHSIAQALDVARQLAEGRGLEDVEVGALDFWSQGRDPGPKVEAGR